MQVWVLAGAGVLGFWLFCDKSRLRELYPSALFMCYIRFIEQYVLVEILHVWKYNHLPLPFSNLMNTPVVIDLLFYPVVGYLFMQKYPTGRPNRLFYLIFWALALTINEYIAVATGTIKYKAPWGLFESYILYAAALVLLIWQYKFYARKVKLVATDEPETEAKTP